MRTSIPIPYFYRQMSQEVVSVTNKLRTSENDFTSLTSASSEKISSLEKQVIIIRFKLSARLVRSCFI